MNKGFLKTLLTMVGGVILAGLAMYYGAKNSVPFLSEARKGFDA